MLMIFLETSMSFVGYLNSFLHWMTSFRCLHQLVLYPPHHHHPLHRTAVVVVHFQQTHLLLVVRSIVIQQEAKMGYLLMGQL